MSLNERTVFVHFHSTKKFAYKRILEFSASEFMHLCFCVCGRACELAWITPGPGLKLWSHSRGPKSATHCTDLGAAHLCACGVC